VAYLASVVAVPNYSSYDFGKIKPIFPHSHRTIFPARPGFDRTPGQIGVIAASAKNGNQQIPAI
jgi:hypothetical protein